MVWAHPRDGILRPCVPVDAPHPIAREGVFCQLQSGSRGGRTSWFSRVTDCRPRLSLGGSVSSASRPVDDSATRGWDVSPLC